MDNNEDLNIPAFLKRDKNWKPDPVADVPAKKVTPAPVPEPVATVETPDGPTHYEKIQRGKRENAGELVAEINGHYDDFLLKGTEFNAYEFFRSREVKPAIVQIIIEKFQAELNELLGINSDPELKAAYKNINVKATVKFLDGIVSDGDRWIDNQKVGKVRKTRKVRINPEKKVKSLKFQREDRDLKLLSIPPEKIIGAQELWTYNTKYKHLTHYVARSRAGFTVKGTKLQDFDVDNSIAKVLRKPEEVLTKVLEKKKKILDGLSTKPIIPTGRINENTILLRVG